MPHFTLVSGTMAEPVEVYTEQVDQDVISVPENFKRVIGIGTNLKGFAYYTTDMKKLGVMYGVKDGETYVYQTEADAEADQTVTEKFPIE